MINVCLESRLVVELRSLPPKPAGHITTLNMGESVRTGGASHRSSPIEASFDTWRCLLGHMSRTPRRERGLSISGMPVAYPIKSGLISTHKIRCFAHRPSVSRWCERRSSVWRPHPDGL